MHRWTPYPGHSQNQGPRGQGIHQMVNLLTKEKAPQISPLQLQNAVRPKPHSSFLNERDGWIQKGKDCKEKTCNGSALVKSMVPQTNTVRLPVKYSHLRPR